jgi:uncharacterized protein YbjT (DUF2867 family)
MAMRLINTPSSVRCRGIGLGTVKLALKAGHSVRAMGGRRRGHSDADKDAQEWIIRRSRLDWTIVRPTILTDGERTGAYRVLVDARDWRSGFISRADVADRKYAEGSGRAQHCGKILHGHGCRRLQSR